MSILVEDSNTKYSATAASAYIALHIWMAQPVYYTAHTESQPVLTQAFITQVKYQQVSISGFPIPTLQQIFQTTITLDFAHTVHVL